MNKVSMTITLLLTTLLITISTFFVGIRVGEYVFRGIEIQESAIKK